MSKPLYVDHIDRLELADNADRQAFMGELVEHVEHPVSASWLQVNGEPWSTAVFSFIFASLFRAGET